MSQVCDDFFFILISSENVILGVNPILCKTVIKTRN